MSTSTITLSLLGLAISAGFAVGTAFGQHNSARMPAAPPTQTCCSAPANKPSAVLSTFAARADALLAAGLANKAAWGILVVDAETGETLYEHDADKHFLPASNLKIFTTALALAKLGPGFRFRTTVETQGTLATDGRLAGDLVLVGRGDPNLSNRKFPFVKQPDEEGPPEIVLAQLADAVLAKGVRHIAGDVVADDSYFPRERYPSGWELDDLVWSYGAAISAIAVNDNTVTLTLEPGTGPGAPATFSITPWTADFKVQNEVVTTAAGSKPDLTLTREPGSPLILLRGFVPAGSAPRKLVVAIEQPAEHAAALLKRLLEERGVIVAGVARARHENTVSSAPGDSRVLAEHVSVPLADGIQVVNKMSENLHAEMLLRTAARQSGLWSSPEDLSNFAQEFYATAGIAAGDVLQSDACGLSRRDLVTARAAVAILRYASLQPWFGVYFSSLPIAGEDGTLLDRFKNAPAAGRIHAKTGSVEHVRTLSGYADTLSGRRVIFSILCNNLAAKNLESISTLDALAVAMVEDLGKSVPATPTNQNHAHKN